MAKIDISRRRRGSPEERGHSPIEGFDTWLRQQQWLDGPADALQSWVGGIYGLLGRPGRTLKSVLHGTKVLGHPLHPAITDIPLGAWAAAAVADWASHITRAVPAQTGDLALAVGIVAALGAVLSGYTDFHETYGQERRYGLVHGLTMTSVTVVMLVCLGLRWLWGQDGTVLVAALATAGEVMGLGGAFFGGHLSFGFGTMVNHLAFSEGPTEFVSVGAPDDFPEGALKLADAAGMPALIVRLQGRLYGLADVCGHAGGPLHEGALEDDVVTCPWHGSRFCIRNGHVLDGPATFNQPAMEVSEDAGSVQVKLARPLH